MYDRFLMRFDAQGDTLWTRDYQNLNGYSTADVNLQSSDEGFLLAGFSYYGTANTDALVIKTNELGDTLWSYEWGGPFHDAALAAIQSPDGGYLIAVESDVSGNLPTISNPVLIKLDSLGNEQWVKVYQYELRSGFKVVNNISGGYTILATVYNTIFNWGIGAVFIQVNPQGNIVNTSFTQNTDFLHGCIVNSDGSYTVIGNTQHPSYLSNHLVIAKYDVQLNEVWRKNYGDTTFYGDGAAIISDGYQGYATCGMWKHHAFFMRTDSIGEVKHSIIQGKIISDYNNNCIDDNEPSISNQLVEVSLRISNLGYTNSDGEYTIQVYDTGQATVTWYPPNSYWTKPACQPNAFTVNIPYNDTLNLDIFAQPIIDCPDLNVSINTPLLRRCFQNTYTVNYCNNGTLPANSAYIEIEMDPYLTVDSASIPWVLPQQGNLYRFNLDTVGIGQCGSFNLWVTVDCDSTELGQTHCVSAHIYPDSICLPPNPAWDGSSVAVTGKCDTGDTLDLKIENVGTGDMTSPSFFLIAEDNVMYQSGNFQLQSGDSLKYRFKGNGSTFTLIANQVEGHPGSSFPMVSIEGCGTNNQGTFSKGFVTQYPQDDQNGYVDILCLQNIGAYDPNDKRAEPQGLNNEGFITANQPLDYTIRFQNTGTDTAFTVVLRDTLSANLDITTLYLTGASHAYTFQIIGSNVLEWTFPNILLPDSNTNEPLSHGFVSFKINQTDGNAPGTEITNRAGIYFDFNPPIITNTTLNTVIADYKTWFTFIQSPESKLQLGIYPNPNNGTFSLDFTTQATNNYEFVMYDLAGAKQFGQTLTGTAPYVLQPELPTGMYIYQLLENGVAVNMGKVVVNK